ncbi:MAG: DNA repair protein RecO [Bdellovibrionales bacterium]
MTQKDRILVLRAFKHGESDLIVHGLNPLGARLSFFVRGGAKSQKRFPGGILEPTHYLDVSFRPGRGDEGDPLHSLQEATLLREFPKLRTDYSRLEAALHILKLVHRLSQHGVIDSPDLFNLTGNALASIETSSDLGKLKIHFEIKILASQGVLPSEPRFQPFLHAALQHCDDVKVNSDDRRWLEAQAHAHLEQYMGTW